MSLDSSVGRVEGRRGADLPVRFEDHVRSSYLLPKGSRLAVALSGGADSIVLLDLLRSLEERWDWSVSAAHFDHGMRAGSATDAEWVRSQCERQGIACRIGRAAHRPGSEAEARDARYRFLHRASGQLGAQLIVTAHHADDQAETVLFRLRRGTGLAGLSGIPARREPGIVRPLLPFWRDDLTRYAKARRLEYREDPTNRNLTFVRNRIRHQIIPAIEADAPDFRRRLHRLAARADGAARALDRSARHAIDDLVLEESKGRVVVARGSLRAYDKCALAHLLRVLAARVGPAPGRVGTSVALKFIKDGSSGRAIRLHGGVVIRREFDRFIFESSELTELPSDEELVLPHRRSGDASVRIGGGHWRVRWARERATRRVGSDGEHVAWFDRGAIDFPLTVRAWRPGDRMVTPAGTRKLKKIFGDRRVGLSERGSYPTLADRSGVLWVVGLARGTRAAAGESEDTLSVRLERRDE